MVSVPQTTQAPAEDQLNRSLLVGSSETMPGLAQLDSGSYICTPVPA